MPTIAVGPQDLHVYLEQNPGFGKNSHDHLHYIDWGEESRNVHTIFDSDPRERGTLRRLIRNGQLSYHCNSITPNSIDPDTNSWIHSWSEYDLVLAWQTPTESTGVPEKLYHSQNRLLKPHRTAVVDQLWRQDRFSRGTVSYTQERTPDFTPDAEIPTGEFEWQHHVLGWLHSTKGYTEQLVTWENNAPPPLEYWRNAAINIITETEWEYVNLTEKTYSNMLWAKPFVVMGAAGVLNHVETLGYENYSDVMDLSFDAEQRLKHRAKGLVRSVLSHQSAQELHRAAQPTALRNQQRVIRATANLVFPSILEDDTVTWIGYAERVKNNCYLARQQARTML